MRPKDTPQALPSWFKKKGYLHFDFSPNLTKHPEIALKLIERITDSAYIERHAFLPFIENVQIVHRRKPNAEGKHKKSRPIKFASHLDANIYGYYGSLLSAAYEQYLQGKQAAPCVLAYRASLNGRDNIDFAREVFEHIRARGACAAIAFDVEQFFETLVHQTLQRNWLRMLCQEDGRLPSDHYKVFRSLTRYSHVEKKALQGVLQEAGIVSRGRYCSIEDFRQLVKGQFDLLRTNTEDIGIPQGSSMSAVLSNIYMIDFDARIAGIAEQRGWLYRRYSDDILVVCGIEDKSEAQQLIQDELQALRLTTNAKKTVTSEFKLDDAGRLHLVDEKKPLQYLGFIFDGHRILLRSPSLARYFRKMKSGVKAATQQARRSRKLRLDKQLLYGRYSHFGRRNFISYALRASNEMNSPHIKRQVSRHWNKLAREIAQREGKAQRPHWTVIGV